MPVSRTLEVVYGAMPPHGFKNKTASPETCRARLEAAARTVLEKRLGRTLKESEWARGRARLLEFANILLAWERQAQKEKPGVDNVVIMPKPRVRREAA
jgi:hypothetical protein